MLLRNRGGKDPERMKRLGQSRHEVNVWICMVVKIKPNAVKPNAVKNNIA